MANVTPPSDVKKRSRAKPREAIVTPAPAKPKHSKKPKPSPVYDVHTVIPVASKYKPEYCDQLVAHQSQGLSFGSFAGVIGVNKDTLQEWKKSFPAWAEACTKAYAACLLFYEQMGVLGMTGRTSDKGIKKFNPIAYIYLTKNILKQDFKNNPEEEIPTPLKDPRTIGQKTKDPIEAAKLYQKLLDEK